MSIVPTVGRKIWYRPGSRDCVGGEDPIPQIDGNSPLDATICGVLDAAANRVNLAVMGADGSGPYRRVDVLLAQDAPPEPGQCAWMPYQQGQAKAPAAPAVDVSALHQTLEAKGKEIHDSLSGAAAEISEHLAKLHEGLKAAAAEGEEKLRALVKEITDALNAPANPPAAEPAAETKTS